MAFRAPTLSLLWPTVALLTAISFELLAPAWGYGTGAPESVCSSLTPGHNLQPQQTELPYNVTLSTNTLSPGRRAKVIIQRLESGPTFKGFMVQARRLNFIGDADSQSVSVVGRFLSRNHKLLPCSGPPNTTITHSENRDKVSVTLYWQAPSELPDSAENLDVEFWMTVVRDYSTYWVAHRTAPLRISPSGQEPPPAPTPAAKSTTTPLPTSTDSTTSESPNVAADDDRDDENPVIALYDSCLLSKGCFGLTDECLARRNCELMVTHELLNNGRLRFQLVGRVPFGHYLAVGISKDSSMGDDAVIYCLSDDQGRYIVRHAYNRGRRSEPLDIGEAAAAAAAVFDVSGARVDGYMMCEFTHAASFVANGQRWDLVDASSANPALHLLVASGVAGADSERRLQYHHSRRRATASPLLLGAAAAAVGGRARSDNILLRVHGALMVAAWLGAAGTGMLVARYYKRTWLGRRLNGLDLWFQCHRTMMVFCVLLTVAGVACIFVQLGGWTSTPLFGGAGSSPHPLLGAVCTVLACLQPLMAACRPHPDAARRPIFNWLHWLVGSAAHTLAVAAIFFAVELPAARLPFWTYWLLAAQVGFHAACHVLLSLQQCWADRRLASKTQPARAVPPGLAPSPHEVYGMRERGSVVLNGYTAYQHGDAERSDVDAPGSSFRRTLLGVYVTVNLLVVTLLVLMIVFAPADDWL